MIWRWKLSELQETRHGTGFIICLLFFFSNICSVAAGEWVYNHNSTARITSPQKFRQSWSFLLFTGGGITFEEGARNLLQAGVKEVINTFMDFTPPRPEKGRPVMTGSNSRFRVDGPMLVMATGRFFTPDGVTGLVNLKETTLPVGSEAFNILASLQPVERDDSGRLVLDVNGQPVPVTPRPPAVPPLEKHTGFSD